MERTFEVIDYVIFILTLTISVGISIYFGCVGSKQQYAKQYLYGANTLSSLPVGLSLLSSALSTTAIVGTVQEIYFFGTQILAGTIGMIFGLIITWNLILPVFCNNLNLEGPYEYFERRFNKEVRVLLSVIYITQFLFYGSLVLYISTSSFSEASGIDLYMCTTTIGIICTLYTLVGGFSGVIWTDVMQVILMFFSCFYIMFKGLSESGGFVNVLYEAAKGQRLQALNFSPNPFIRLTAWSAMFGMLTSHVAHSSCAASGIQRIMALSNEKEARISSALSAFGFVLVYLISGIMALCLYVYFANCDPLITKKINNSSQLLALYVNEIIANSAGFVGLFNAGLLSAGLSSLSAELNTVSGLFYYDILIKVFKIRENKTKATAIMKLIIALCGIILIICSPLIPKFSIYISGFTILAWSNGAKLGVMVLATSFPNTNSKGAFCAIIISILSIAFISLKAMYLDTSSAYALPRSVTNCTDLFNNFTEIIDTVNQTKGKPIEVDDTFSFFKLSYMYYSVLGVIITLTVGIIASCITGGNNVSNMDSRLIIPCLRPGYEKCHWYHKVLKFKFKKTIIVET